MNIKKIFRGLKEKLIKIRKKEVLAFYIYPSPAGTDYSKYDLKNAKKVEELFDYCQILEGVITKSGWEFLICFHGYEKLFDINNKSGWIDAEDLEDYKLWVEYYRSL